MSDACAPWDKNVQVKNLKKKTKMVNVYRLSILGREEGIPYPSPPPPPPIIATITIVNLSRPSFYY
jgi:hypothetical protein